MTKEFIPYEQALALKKLGFDESPHTKTFRTPASDYNFNGYRK